MEGGVTLEDFKFLTDAIAERKNPNGCPITGTWFVEHKYTKYDLVNKLYFEVISIFYRVLIDPV